MSGKTDVNINESKNYQKKKMNMFIFFSFFVVEVIEFEFYAQVHLIKVKPT